MDSLKSDEELLIDFRTARSERAFHALVERYLGMVLSVAKRKTGDPDAAEEIAQNVFAVLARKADELPTGTVLGGWLHRAATLESAEHHRREYRRRRVMNELRESLDVQSAGRETGSFAEYLADLDGAMARLSARDRDALILRFHGGLPFVDLGERLGKSEEAARKQVSRALEKLGRLLGKGRETVPTAALLAASLPQALTESAPAGLVHTVATGALTSSVSTAASGSTFAFQVLLLMKTQTGVLTLIGLLLLGGAFFAGRQSAAGFGNRLVEEAARSAADRQQAVSRARALREAQSGKPAPTARRTVPQIMDAAADEFRSGDGSVGAYWRARLILEELDVTEYADAIAHIESYRVSDQKTFETLGALVAGLWGSVEGEAAMAWVEENLEERRGIGYRNVLECWSTHDPVSAYAWYKAKAESSDSGMSLHSFRWLTKPVFRGWAQSDPAGAMKALEKVAVEDESGAVYGIASAAKHSPNPDPILKAIAASEESRVRSKVIEETAGSWAKDEPHSAAAWIDSVPMASAMDRLKAKSEVAEEWIEHRPKDLVEIGAWFITGAPDGMRDQLAEMVVQAIEERNGTGDVE